MRVRQTSNEKLLAIGITLLAVISPLLIDQKASSEPEEEEDEPSISFTSWLPLLLVVLIVAIGMSGYLGKSCASSDPYWIHKTGGSSCGIVILLMVLVMVLRFKGILG